MATKKIKLNDWMKNLNRIEVIPRRNDEHANFEI